MTPILGFISSPREAEVMDANLLLFKTVIAGDSWGEVAVPVIEERLAEGWPRGTEGCKRPYRGSVESLRFRDRFRV